MTKTYVGAWPIFDEDYTEGLDKAFQRYQEAGISHLMYAGIAHTFDVNPQYYELTKIDPHIQIDFEKNQGDIFGTKYHLITSDFNEVRALARRYDLNLEVNITPGVSEPIVAAYPDVAVMDIDGNKSKHWMCPSNPDVRNYFMGRVEDILRHNAGIREVELDVVSLDFYDPQVVPDWVLPELNPLGRLAIGNCFCDHCVKRAQAQGINVDRIKREIRAIHKEATHLNYQSFLDLSDAYRGVFDIVRYLLQHQDLLTWIKFRSGLVNDFVLQFRNFLKHIDPTVQLSSDLVAPSFSWTLGQVYADQPGLTDMTKLMLYHKCIGSFEAKPLKRIQGAIPEISDREILDQYYRLKGFSGSYQMDEFVKDGIGVENVYYEVRKARLEVGPHHPIIAGLVADSPATTDDVRQAVQLAAKAGADGFMLHMWYHDAPKDNIVAFGEELKQLGKIHHE
ncbi:MAG: hypothetical protein GYA17_11585 [Chloroflexi bacterium]|jgi:hypothetical protein|nr:hypothetical protein [Chloroflexota bacterium]